MSDLTVVYYTSNREHPDFERRILEEIQASAAGLPLITVSQKPMDVGRNICVGEIGQSQENIVLQASVGAYAATTRYVVMTESDCLYPKEIFHFTPSDDHTIYYPRVGYVIWEKRKRFWLKNYRELVGVSSRENFLRVLAVASERKPKYLSRLIRHNTRQEAFETEAPLVSIKTSQGMHWRSPHGSEWADEIPYWGKASDVWAKYFGTQS